MGGSIFRKTPDIGLASYSIIPLRVNQLRFIVNSWTSKRTDKSNISRNADERRGEGQSGAYRGQILSPRLGNKVDSGNSVQVDSGIGMPMVWIRPMNSHTTFAEGHKKVTKQ